MIKKVKISKQYITTVKKFNMKCREIFKKQKHPHYKCQLINNENHYTAILTIEIDYFLY